MSYVIQDIETGQFWTGSGWSPHIGEGLSLRGRRARITRANLWSRFNNRMRLVPSPSDMWADDDDNEV